MNKTQTLTSLQKLKIQCRTPSYEQFQYSVIKSDKIYERTYERHLTQCVNSAREFFLLSERFQSSRNDSFLDNEVESGK